MRVLLFGASGMVGRGVLLECLEDDGVTSVLVVGRSPVGLTHEKLREIRHDDFLDYAAIEGDLHDLDACFYCLGVSSAGMSEEQYHRVTHDFALRAAETLVRLNPEMTFCFVSGAGTDSTEQGRIMWARVKGKAENAILRLPFKAAYMFRPGFIQPMKGIRSRTRMYRIGYAIATPFYPVLHALFPTAITTTERIGRAMIRVVRDGYSEKYLGNRQINEVAEA